MSAVFTRRINVIMAAGALVLGIFMFTPPAHASTDATSHSGYYYSYSSIENLWVAAGGSWATAAHAACIAAHESGGNANAISATNDYGIFQEHNRPDCLNVYQSARVAVQMSDVGRNWSPWTTSGSC